MTTAEKLKASMEVMKALEESGRISVLNWLYTVDDELPDDDTTVFVASNGEEGPIEASHQCGNWFRYSTLELLTGVYAWAHIPALPPLPKPIADDKGAR